MGSAIVTNGFRQSIRNPCRCLLDWISSEVCIAGCGLNLTVAEKLADHR